MLLASGGLVREASAPVKVPTWVVSVWCDCVQGTVLSSKLPVHVSVYDAV